MLNWYLALGREAAISHWVQPDAPETMNAMLTAFLCGERVPQSDELGPRPRSEVCPSLG